MGVIGISLGTRRSAGENVGSTTLLYGGVCCSSRVCAGICEGVSIVSCNEACRIDIG